MLNNGSFAVAVVHRQVVVVQAVRTHTKREKFLDVTPYAAFGGSRIFLALSEKHIARIPTSAVLSVLPSSAPLRTLGDNSDESDSDDSDSDDNNSRQHLTGANNNKPGNNKSYFIFGADVVVGEGTIELPENAFAEFVRLSEQHYNRPRSASRSSKLWTSLTGRAGSSARY